jgi:hypothetical protein
MPRRKQQTLRASLERDIEAVRDAIRSGVPWLPDDQQKAAAMCLTMEQRALLSNLTPFRSAAKFIHEIDVETLSVAKKTLKADIAQAKARVHAS